MTRSALVLFLAISASSSFAAQPASGQDKVAAAIAVLQAQYPKFEWQAKTAITIDINADGIDDIAVLGYTKDTAAVGVVLGQVGKGTPVAKYMDFMRGDASAERSMSGRYGTLKALKQDEGVKDALGDLPEGYRICDKCYEIEVVGDGESDPIFIYWDTVANALNWWRA